MWGPEGGECCIFVFWRWFHEFLRFLFLRLRMLGCQQINHQNCLKLRHMLILAINYNLREKNPNILDLKFIFLVILCIFLQSSSFKKIKMLWKWLLPSSHLKQGNDDVLLYIADAMFLAIEVWRTREHRLWFVSLFIIQIA